MPVESFVVAFAVVACACAVAFAADGEGTAAVFPSGRLVAAATATITITYEAGPGGIPVGGGVAVGLHHASAWPDLQITEPDKPGYMTVLGSAADNFELQWYPDWAPAEACKNAADMIFHRVLFAKVKHTALKPGERVKIVLGANARGVIVQKYVEKTAEFHVMTDGDGDGVYEGIACQPVVEIVANEPHHLVASVPATIVAGEPFEMQIRAEDEFFNVARAYGGNVTVRDEDGSTIAAAVPVLAGMTRVRLSVASPGPRRFRLSDGRLEGRSNPCRAFTTAPEYRIYWGDLHGHTSLSDGLADTPYDYFEFGRNVANLDVCAASEHGHPDWPQSIDAVKEFYEAGRFVTILAQEVGGKYGTSQLYFRDDCEDHISAWPPTYEEFLAHILEQYGADGRVITTPIMLAYTPGSDDWPFGRFDERTQRAVELYSMHGCSEYPGNPRELPLMGHDPPRLKYLQAGLAKGLRFGVMATSDNHDSHPGRSIFGTYPGGMTAFVAKELTREGIWDAFWNRRVYATSFDRIYMEFTVNGHIMGSDVTTHGPCRVEYYVIALTDNVEVFLIRNNEEIRKDTSANGVVDVRFEDDPPAGTSSYYLRVVQDNGERAWSTPIWVARE